GRGVLDGDPRVGAVRELWEQPAAVAHVDDDDVGAPRLAPRRQRPDAQVVQAPHAGHAQNRGLDLPEVEVGRRALEQNVDGLPQEPPRAGHDDEAIASDASGSATVQPVATTTSAATTTPTELSASLRACRYAPRTLRLMAA